MIAQQALVFAKRHPGRYVRPISWRYPRWAVMFCVSPGTQMDGWRMVPFRTAGISSPTFSVERMLEEWEVIPEGYPPTWVPEGTAAWLWHRDRDREMEAATC